MEDLIEHMFLDMQALHRTLHTLEVGRNRLGNEGMESLKHGLMRNRSIARLGLMELGLSTIGKWVCFDSQGLLVHSRYEYCSR